MCSSDLLGDAVFTTVRQGARIEITGHLSLNKYVDKDGKVTATLRIRVDDVAHKLNRVEVIKLRPKAESAVPQ